MDGEVVERADPHIGLLHRGTEKLIEHKTYLQAMPYFDRLDYVSPMIQEHAFVYGRRKTFKLRCTRKSFMDTNCLMKLLEYLNHTLQIGAQGLDLGATTPFFMVI